MDSIAELRRIVARLRAPDGCPWDREQTHQSLRPQILEEVYEVLEAIDEADDNLLREELGDVLLHIVFHAQLAQERGAFDLDAVARGINDKLVRRHPHVFGGDSAADSAEVLKKWDDLKKKEKPHRNSLLDGVPPILPSLMRAQELQKKAAKAGFDWPGPEPVFEKIHEEIDEVRKDAGNPDKAREELGDLLFAVVNLCRHLGADAELALRDANLKFERRFRFVEAALKARGRTPQQSTLEEMDALWNEAKAGEK